MEAIILTRTTSTDAWMKAVASDYTVPEKARVFEGTGLAGERVAFWIGPDGGGFGAIDRDPVGYVRLSEAFATGDKAKIAAAMAAHGGVEEYEFEEGAFSYGAKVLKVDAELSLF